jgi:protein ImuB
MMRRFASLWFPTWPTDRWRRRNRPVDRPTVLVAAVQGATRLTAVDALAAGEGLAPGMTLADARALAAEIHVAEADPGADVEALDALAVWATRYAPFAAIDGADGIVIDITAAAHLFGSEAPNRERHLKLPAEMAHLFAARPDAIARTVEIAERCRFSLDELR